VSYLTETVKVSKKYQVVIPKEARRELEIEEGDKLVVSVKNGQVLMKPTPKRYTNYMLGLHRKAWRGVEAAKYVEKERRAWKKKKIE